MANVRPYRNGRRKHRISSALKTGQITRKFSSGGLQQTHGAEQRILTPELIVQNSWTELHR